MTSLKIQRVVRPIRRQTQTRRFRVIVLFICLFLFFYNLVVDPLMTPGLVINLKQHSFATLLNKKKKKSKSM